MRGEARNTSHEQEQKSPPTTLASTLLEKKTQRNYAYSARYYSYSMDQQVEESLINCCLKVWCFLLDESCSTVESPINMSWTMLPRKIFKFWSKGRKNTGHRGIQGKVHLIPFPSGFRIHAENFITEELMKTNWTSFVCWLFRGSKLISFQRIR